MILLKLPPSRIGFASVQILFFDLLHDRRLTAVQLNSQVGDAHTLIKGSAQQLTLIICPIFSLTLGADQSLP